MTTRHHANQIIRDTGPYSGRNLAKGASITDAAQVFAALREGMTVEQVRDGARGGKLLPQRGRRSRDRIWASLHHRYLTHRIPWVISAITDALGHGEQSPEFNSLLYLHYALRDITSALQCANQRWWRQLEDEVLTPLRLESRKKETLKAVQAELKTLTPGPSPKGRGENEAVIPCASCDRRAELEAEGRF